MIRLLSVALVACLSVTIGADSLAAPKSGGAGKSGPAPAKETISKAITPEVLAAVKAEMKRSQERLRIRGAEAPYFFGYKLTEVEVNDVAASLGSTTSKKGRHFVNLEAHVHVGSYQNDNSNFVSATRDGGQSSSDGISEQTLPLEPNPAIARRITWLATDDAYKEALEQLQAKEEALRGGAAPGRKDVPSYSKRKPIVQDQPVLVPVLEKLDDIETRAAKISAVFRDIPHVRDSRVAFTSFLERRWLINSEGSTVHDTRRVSGVLIVATSQAQDGQELSVYYTRYGHTAHDLPGDAELETAARQLADQLDQLRKAPIVEPYTGPVLFEGEGAVDVVRYTLAPHMSGTPLPVGLSGRDAKRFGAELANRVGQRVVAQSLSVIDDPTAKTADGTQLIGTYKIDDEGVPAQRVQVIQGGKLINLLMSRTPSKDIQESNGHARLSMPGGVFRGSATNLLIDSRGGMTPAALRKKLLAEARSQGLDYALVIKQLDDAAITANPELTRLERLQLLQTVNQDAPPMALVAYKVYPGGREEMVRGVQLEPVSVRAWRDVMATSKKRTVRNFLASLEDPLLHLVAGGGPGFVPSAGIESSVATPDLLFREIDVKPSALGRRPPPMLPAP